MPHAPRIDDLRIDAGRLARRLDELASIGAIPGGGCARLALTDADRAGRDLVVTWMRDLGLAIAVDAVGNVVATMAHHTDRAPVLMGSHIDTVRTGGRYDGNLGVLAGLEVIETVLASGLTPARPLAVGFFTNEEGSRFAPDMLGSLVYVGGMAVEAALDVVGIDGARLGDELDRIGYAGAAPSPAPAPHAFVELHIEQGPVLDLEGVCIGVVDMVQGISWQELTITGQSNHAGTTPMRFRHDAGYVAARIAVAVREIVQELGGDHVGTVGAITVNPNLINVVAASATLTIDLRNTHERALELAERRVAAAVAQIAAAEGVEVVTRNLARFEPVHFDPRITDLVEQTARQAGLSTRRMPSGAGHDAQMFARVCPAGMIFVPSVGGLSHNPAEHTALADLEAGTNVLLHTVVALAEEGDPPWPES